MKKVLLISIVLVFSLAACTGVSVVESPTDVPTPVPVEPTPTSEQMDDMKDDMDDDMKDDMAEDMKDDGMDDDMDNHDDGDMKDDGDDMMKPEVRGDLEASDPSQFMIASGEYQFVEFFAFWCPTCVNMAPTVHQLEADFYGQVDFTFLDIDDPATDEFKTQLGYLYQPHYFLLSPDGEVLGQWTGYVDQDVLAGVLSDLP